MKILVRLFSAGDSLALILESIISTRLFLETFEIMKVFNFFEGEKGVKDSMVPPIGSKIEIKPPISPKKSRML